MSLKNKKVTLTLILRPIEKAGTTHPTDDPKAAGPGHDPLPPAA